MIWGWSNGRFCKIRRNLTRIIFVKSLDEKTGKVFYGVEVGVTVEGRFERWGVLYEGGVLGRV